MDIMYISWHMVLRMHIEHGLRPLLELSILHIIIATNTPSYYSTITSIRSTGSAYQSHPYGYEYISVRPYIATHTDASDYTQCGVNDFGVPTKIRPSSVVTTIARVRLI